MMQDTAGNHFHIPHRYEPDTPIYRKILRTQPPGKLQKTLTFITGQPAILLAMKAPAATFAERVNPGIDYKQLVDDQIRDHLDWFANRGKYENSGFRATVDAVAPKIEGNIWKRIYGLPEDGDQEGPKSLEIKVGADFEMCILHAPRIDRPMPKDYEDYLAACRLQDLLEQLHEAFPRRCPADAMTAESLQEFRQKCDRIIRGEGRLTKLEDEIRFWETPQEPFHERDRSFTSFSLARQSSSQARRKLMQKLTRSAKIPHLLNLISAEFFDGRLEENQSNLRYIRDLLLTIGAKVPGDYLIDDIMADQQRATASDEEACSYLHHDIPVDDEKLDLPHRNYRITSSPAHEVRFVPTHCYPPDKDDPEIVNVEMLDASGYITAHAMPHTASSIQTRHQHFRRQLSERVHAVGGTVQYRRSHVHVSLTDSDRKTNWCLGADKRFNPLTDILHIGTSHINEALGCRNPDAKNDSVACAPKHLDILYPGSMRFTHLELRNTYRFDQFARTYPELVHAKVDPFTFSLLELLGAMRLSIEAMHHFAPHINEKRLYYYCTRTPKDRRSVLGDNFRQRIYGEQLAAYLEQKSKAVPGR